MSALYAFVWVGACATVFAGVLCVCVLCVVVFVFLRLFTDMFAEEKGDWKTQMKNTKKKLTLFSSKRNCGEETRHLTPEG